MSSFLSLDDFKFSIDANLDSFEVLVEVSRVASLKLQQEKAIRKPRSLKRSHHSLISVFNEKDCVFGNGLIENKKKKKENHSLISVFDEKDCIFGNGLIESKQKKKEKQEEERGLGNNNYSEYLPEELCKIIKEMGGTDVRLLMEKKRVYSTDISPQHNRLSLPLNQMKNMGFLSEEEENVLLGNKNKKGQGLEVVLVEPCLKKTKIVLAKWEIGKTSSYVLRSSWMKVVTDNDIKKDDILQLWSFRDIQQQLCIILFKLS